MAKDPRTMTAKGKPGSGLASPAGNVPNAPKKKKQANGSNPAGYSRTKGKGSVKKAAAVRGGRKSTRSSSDQVPGKTNYSYAGKK